MNQLIHLNDGIGLPELADNYKRKRGSQVLLSFINQGHVHRLIRQEKVGAPDHSDSDCVNRTR